MAEHPIFHLINQGNVTEVFTMSQDDPSCLTQLDAKGQTPLVSAIVRRRTPVVDQLDHDDIVHILIQNGADVNTLVHGKSPLFLAVSPFYKLNVSDLELLTARSLSPYLHQAFTQMLCDMIENADVLDKPRKDILNLLYETTFLELNFDPPVKPAEDMEEVHRLYRSFLHKRVPVPRDPIPSLPVYTMLGHGCDTGEILRVPKNCVYVTLSICGETMMMDSFIQETFNTLFRDSNKLLQDPIRYKKELSKLMNVHIHYDGQFADGTWCDPTYMDCNYHPFLYYKGDNTVSASGLHLLGDDLFMKGHPSVEMQKSPYTSLQFVMFPPAGAPPESLDVIYGNSLLPTVQDIKSSIKGVYTAAKVGEVAKRITQSELFKTRPGIYYNIVCREPCRSTTPLRINLRRQHSERKDISPLKTPEFTPLSFESLRNALELYLRSPEEFAPIGTWNVSRVIHLIALFEDMDFNEDITTWDVSEINSMEDTFKNSRFNRSLAPWNPKKLFIFGAANSRIPELFDLLPKLQILDITNCPIHHLNFDKLHPMFKIKCKGVPLDSDTVTRLIAFYTSESKLPPKEIDEILEQFRSGAMKRKRTIRKKKKTRKPSKPPKNTKRYPSIV